MQRQGSRSLLAAILASGLLALPASAPAQSIQDATCPAAGGGNSVFSGDSRFAQTFTAVNTGKLTSARINITKNLADGPGNYIFSIALVDGAGSPTNTTLATTVVPEANVPGGSVNLPTTATFSTPPAVTAGQQYALVVSRPGSGANGLRLNSRSGTGCPGSLFLSMSQTGPFADLGSDLVFTTFVDRPPTATIRKHPRKKSDSDTARFKFSAGEGETNATFQCRLDKGKFKNCKSPRTYRGLQAGKHVFRVTAIDAVGNVSSAPAKFKWKVVPARR